MVIVMDESKLARGRWRLGRIIKILNGSARIARGANLHAIVKGGRRIQADRPLQKLVPLEVNTLAENNR